MKSTAQTTMPPELRSLVDRLEAKGCQVEVIRLEIEPMPASPTGPVAESSAPFADPLPPAALLKQVNHHLENKLADALQRFRELSDLLVAHGFKPGDPFIDCLKKVLDHWDGRPFVDTPGKSAEASDGAPASAGKSPAPEIPADRHLRAGFPTFSATNDQAAAAAAARLRPSMNGKPVCRDEIGDSLDGPASQAQPRHRRYGHTISSGPRLCWRYGSIPGRLHGYLEPEPENTLYFISPADDGSGTYKLLGFTEADQSESPRFTSIFAAQNDAQIQLAAWISRHLGSAARTTTAAAN